ncbi:MAG: hypothetical protein HFH93_09775 [Lachnospiraceae bacterium]|nr:hypothetical protein [Lachnospiraceae bacterium]
MKTYLTEFFEEFSYPEEACSALTQAYDRITANPLSRSGFEALLRCYANDKNMDYGQAFHKMAEISGEVGIHNYTGELLLLICFSRTLRGYYEEAGIDQQIWHTSMCDLKYKLDECKCVYDIWGTFVCWWFTGFFDMTRFGFLKLQFEIQPFGYRYEKKGIVLTPESPVLNTHIPRTGTKLDPESVRKSYELGVAFFRERFQVDPVAFVCHSWLLYPRNKEVLSPDSNLYAFISGYDILKVEEDKDYSEVWRLFDVNYEGDVEKLPQDTSLRRGYAEWIRKGEKTGCAYGVHIM